MEIQRPWIAKIQTQGQPYSPPDLSSYPRKKRRAQGDENGIDLVSLDEVPCPPEYVGNQEALRTQREINGFESLGHRTRARDGIGTRLGPSAIAGSSP